MPVYEYGCIQCETFEEVTRKFDDPEIIPSCSKCAYGMVRYYNSPGIQFKGKGFYKTDNR